MMDGAPSDKESRQSATISESALRWQCRRGMLELDLLLNRFLDVGYNDLSPHQTRRFEDLLRYPDQTLYELLMGQMRSADPELACIIELIRASGQPSDIKNEASYDEQKEHLPA